MGKSSYKKFKKQEKAKVKLKGNKTLLPKGQNVTDTSFKVKKIIVKEQLKEHSENELLSKKHLSIKELISRLSHHNTTMRQDALTGLRELVNDHGADLIRTNLSPMLQAAMALTVDIETDVRSDTLKLISAVFNQLTEQELAPIFAMVVCHLTCGMTHIEPAIRSDSLRLLDTMLATHPSLTAAHTPTLLPHFLDLISHRGSDKSRSLSLNLDGRITSEKWRARVIGRLNKLFHVILQHCKKDQTQSVPSIKWKADQHIHLNVYRPLFTATNKSGDIAKLPMKEYAELLMPLLLDTFIEAVPKKDQGESQTGCVVGAETAPLLQSVVEVMLHIWNLLKQSTDSKDLTDWFRTSWSASVVSRMLEGRFPYTVAASSSRKRQRDRDQLLVALQVSGEASCLLLNLQLCLLTFLLTRPSQQLWPQSIQYIRRSLRGGYNMKPEEGAMLCQCLEAATDVSPLPSTPSLLSVVANCHVLDDVDKPINRKAFDFLSNVALLQHHHLHTDPQFTTWLDSLPALLCKPSVPLSVVRSIASIATRKLPAFCNSLDGWIEAILDNLPQLRVSGDPDREGPRLIVGLVYWVTDWDTGLGQHVYQMVQQGSLGKQLTRQLVDLLKLKVEVTEDHEVKTILEDIISL